MSLVLSRLVGESIDIGDGVSVTIVDVRNNRVKLKFDAPLDVVINRREVTERIAGKEKKIVSFEVQKRKG